MLILLLGLLVIAVAILRQCVVVGSRMQVTPRVVFQPIRKLPRWQVTLVAAVLVAAFLYQWFLYFSKFVPEAGAWRGALLQGASAQQSAR